MTDPTPEGVAGQVATVDEAVMKFLPFVSTILGFIPGAQVAVPFMPLVQGALTALDSAAKAVSMGDPGAGVQDIFTEVINHLTPGQPNSQALT